LYQRRMNAFRSVMLVLLSFRALCRDMICWLVIVLRKYRRPQCERRL
jgi:hypothetical protein